ncbi:hypothetical protein DVS28_b0037 (plasmid) [Euzebya pacifica]|uniref:Uncharacterized protein n=1 Tax=Euzebya pacifica TaxID=1608957 RepID=A0A346Y5R0_9ACTN|nr:hypothetical protein [Euzebya pacifica]AXV09807.1 hypothetical protein DVS28_b0037 [Euzebya pacifica]
MNTTSQRIRTTTRRLRDGTPDQTGPTTGHRIGCSCFDGSAYRLLADAAAQH